MVLLDAAFPDEVDLERYFPRRERMTHDEWPTLPEKIDRYSPGTLEKVESDHYMEAAMPARIVEELEQVIAKS